MYRGRRGDTKGPNPGQNKIPADTHRTRHIVLLEPLRMSDGLDHRRHLAAIKYRWELMPNPSLATYIKIRRWALRRPSNKRRIHNLSNPLTPLPGFSIARAARYLPHLAWR